ncbi:MAG: Glycosyl transferase [Selenomonas sp.]|jgi:hypothetical protein|uniref:glycoside hydrolase family 99-like domain-containing protein n=1 Tax=Selenomonas sp. TaxID=2053611 RepID=UPI003D476709
MNKVHLIANYLPQFHVIPENSRWWGEGYTDWVGVRQAEPQYPGQHQPRVPLHENYYSLDDPAVLKWQADLARKYGVYGFGMYHYWFSSELQLLQKPAELLLAHPEIDIHFMFIWDNTSWTRTWVQKGAANDWAPKFDEQPASPQESGMLAELRYGTEADWKKHFDYLLPFFRDERYIKLDGKPMFAFFQPNNDFPLQQKMVAYWEKLAVEAGLPGLICLSKDNAHNKRFAYQMRYSPFSPNNFWGGVKNKLSHLWAKRRQKIRFADYDAQWRSILADARHADARTFLSGFVAFDDTPRRGGEQESFVVTRRRSSSITCANCSRFHGSKARNTLLSRLGMSGARAHTWSRMSGAGMLGSKRCGRPLRRRTRTKPLLRGQMV